MSANGRLALEKIFASKTYREWAASPLHAIDVRKLNAEFEGTKKATCGDLFAQGLQLLCRENPPLTPPDPGGLPAPFSGRGMTLLEPTGGVEDMDAVKAAGFTYVLLNLGYTHGGNWDIVRTRCSSRGITVVPWKRVLSPTDSREIEETALAWNCSATAHNLETEAATTYPPVNLASYVAQNFPARSRAVITEPWAQNNAGWAALKSWVGMPEAFLNADSRYQPQTLVAHLQEQGIPHCVPLFGWGAWSDAPVYIPPSTYLAAWPPNSFAVYFGDSRETQYGEWRR